MRADHIHTLWTDAQDRADSPQDAVALLCDAVAYACLQTATDPATACDRMLAGGEKLLRERMVGLYALLSEEQKAASLKFGEDEAFGDPLMRRRRLYVVG